MKKPTWDNEIRELEDFFRGRQLPEKIKLNGWEMIVNVRPFLSTHFLIVRHHNGEEAYLPYLIRLQNLKKQIEDGQE